MTDQTAQTAQIALPTKLIPVFSGKADVRGAYGGRGSGKTRSFAKMAAVRAYKWAQEGHEGIILCGRQFQNSLDDSSLEEVKLAITSEPWLHDFFDIGEKYIKTKDGRIHFAFSGLDRNIASIKSKSRILLCWVDEAEQVTDHAWTVLIPTIREEESELWVTWNPERKGSATDKRFRQTKDPLYRVEELNWRDNPKFPEKLNRDRLRDLENNPENYAHIWEGGYKTYVEGAYYAKHLAKANDEGRITKLVAEPHLPIKLFMDIGGTGAKSDAFSIWAAQFVKHEIWVLNYYEAVGQPIASHLEWMREHDYTPGNVEIFLPHDGASNDKVYDVSYESAFKAANYRVTVVPNQGKGAAKKRIEEARKLFTKVSFDKKMCAAGLEALGWYHEKKDEARNIGLGPEHDWASHGADAFGLMCVVYSPPKVKAAKRQPKVAIA